MRLKGADDMSAVVLKDGIKGVAGLPPRRYTVYQMFVQMHLGICCYSAIDS